jgi:putative SOS response-associated peptidase YedK
MRKKPFVGHAGLVWKGEGFACAILVEGRYGWLMCGRYTITSAPEAIRALFRYPEEPQFPARYNIAPTQPIPIVRLIDGQRHFALMRWGLMPSWVKDPANFALLINARGESVCEKPAFRNAMKYRRCLIAADGFYEWQASGSGGKQPFYIHPKSGKLLAFAGLWETWTGPNGEEVDTAAIVTTRANGTLAALHDRMPVIVPPEAFDLWLDCTNVDARTAETLIAPAPDDQLAFSPVSTLVNRTANDNPALLQPAAPERVATPVARAPARLGPKPRAPDDGQGVLF